jgi:hypothetical protein
MELWLQFLYVRRRDCAQKNDYKITLRGFTSDNCDSLL